MSKKLEMVFSAPGMLRLNPQSWMVNSPEEDKQFLACLKKSIQLIKDEIHQIYPNYDFYMSILYNGYTEKGIGQRLTTFDHGFDRVFSDSGGLQVVTLGKEITSEIMKDIYINQKDSDVAMSFDEIPARNVETFVKAQRSNISTRVYYPQLAEECAKKTCENIKSQTDFFVDNDCKARTSFITQGNCFEDIMNWFKVGTHELNTSYWDNIRGYAMAASCLGNGERETIENLLAYTHIVNEYDNCHKKNHIHLLGYGSISRIVPAFSMFEMPLIPDDSILSFDSSSLSMNWMLGKLIGLSGRPEEFRKEKDALKIFDILVNKYYNIIKSEVGDFDKDLIVRHLTDNRRSICTTAPSDITGNKTILIARCYLTIGILDQIVNLMRVIKQESDFNNTLLNEVKTITSLDDIDKWFFNNKKYLKTKRIQRELALSLNDFM